MLTRLLLVKYRTSRICESPTSLPMSEWPPHAGASQILPHPCPTPPKPPSGGVISGGGGSPHTYPRIHTSAPYPSHACPHSQAFFLHRRELGARRGPGLQWPPYQERGQLLTRVHLHGRHYHSRVLGAGRHLERCVGGDWMWGSVNKTKRWGQSGGTGGGAFALLSLI